jgi:hypothetical protein
MKTLLYFLFSLVLFVASFFLLYSPAAAQITFQKTFGGTDNDRGFSVQQTTGDGYIISGVTASYGAGNDDVYLIKLDLNGNILWERTYGGTDDEYGSSVIQTSDGGYIIVGTTYSFGLGLSDIYLIRTDSNGDTLWSRTFGGTGQENGISVQQTLDKGYIITGGTQSFGAGGWDIYLIKTDSSGYPSWAKTFGGANDEGASYVQQTSDSGYIITGSTRSFGQTSGDVYLIKIDINGDTLWTKIYGGNDYENGYSVKQTNDGGYIIGGFTTSFGTGYYDVYLIKTNDIGDTLWTKSYGDVSVSDDEAWSIQQNADSSYIITGITNGPAAGYSPLLMKINLNGNILWSKTYGGTINDGAYFGQQTSDNGYIMVGFTSSFGAGAWDIYLIKTDSSGNNGCYVYNASTIDGATSSHIIQPPTIVTSPPTIVTSPATIVGSGGTVTTLCTTVGIPPLSFEEEPGVRFSPNPFSNELNISTNNNAPSQIILYDITSRKLLQQTFINSASLNTSHLSKGIYIYTVTNNKGVIRKGKVVKE